MADDDQKLAKAYQKAQDVQQFGYARDFSAANKAIAESIARTGIEPSVVGTSLPGGGTASLRATNDPAILALRQRMLGQYTSIGGISGQMTPQQAYNFGFSGTLPANLASTGYGRSYLQGFNPREQGVTSPQSPGLNFNPLSPEFNPYQNLMAVGRSFYPAVNYLANFFRGGRQPTSATIPANLAHPMQATGGAEWNPVMRGQSPGLQMIPNFNTQTPITMPNMTGRPRPPVSINQLTQPPSRFSYFPSVMQSL